MALDSRFGARCDGFIYIDILSFTETERKIIMDALHSVART